MYRSENLNSSFAHQCLVAVPPSEEVDVLGHVHRSSSKSLCWHPLPFVETVLETDVYVCVCGGRGCNLLHVTCWLVGGNVGNQKPVRAWPRRIRCCMLYPEALLHDVRHKSYDITIRFIRSIFICEFSRLFFNGLDTRSRRGGDDHQKDEKQKTKMQFRVVRPNIHYSHPYLEF